jgi:hypothetical protein
MNTNISGTNILKILPMLFIILILTGCGNLGTAVVIWPPEDGKWKAGDILVVKDESLLRNTYIVNQPGQRRLKEEVEKWRLRLFRTERRAVKFSTSLGEWRDVYAECLFQGLPMRSEPSNTSSRIYRFREGESMKVVGRDAGPVVVGNLEGYWYRVLAKGGIEGYVFDYYLQVVKQNEGDKEVLNARSTDDPVLNNLLSNSWRPGIFEDLIKNRQVDLNIIKPEYGLFLDTAAKNIRLRLPDLSIDETWTDIVPAGRNRYDFLGSSFRITVNSEYFISVQYKEGDTERYEAYVRFIKDLAVIIEEEQNRRVGVLEKIMEQGPVYGSRAYGELAVLEGGRFSWSGKSSLISRGIISSGAGNSGVIELDHFVDPSIASAHEGVLSFRFDNNETARFLYAYEDGGLRLLYIPPDAIESRRVRSDQFIDPVRLFFTSLSPAVSVEGAELPDR